MKRKNLLQRAFETAKGGVQSVAGGFRRGGFRGGLQAAAVVLGLATADVAKAAPDYSALSTEITDGAAAVVTVATAAIVAGFGIFVLIWGARKIKGALSSGG